MEQYTQWYIKCIRQFADFKGRARRKEFWMFALVNFVVSLVITIVGSIIGTTLLSTIYSLAILLPSLGVGVRRLHDVGKSGWYMLASLIPVIGWIWLLILAAQDSQPGDNQWGPNPKSEELIK